MIDLGTGDGRFVADYARSHPDWLCIGVDANVAPLAKLSEQITRRPAKGGLSNTLFLRGAVEALPDALGALAQVLFVQFPWGSLLRAVVLPVPSLISPILRVCAPDGRLLITLAYDASDRREWARLGLPAVSSGRFVDELRSRYRALGIPALVTSVSRNDPTLLRSSWGRRLRQSRTREFAQIELDNRYRAP